MCTHLLHDCFNGYNARRFCHRLNCVLPLCDTLSCQVFTGGCTITRCSLCSVVADCKTHCSADKAPEAPSEFSPAICSRKSLCYTSPATLWRHLSDHSTIPINTYSESKMTGTVRKGKVPQGRPEPHADLRVARGGGPWKHGMDGPFFFVKLLFRMLTGIFVRALGQGVGLRTGTGWPCFSQAHGCRKMPHLVKKVTVKDHWEVHCTHGTHI